MVSIIVQLCVMSPISVEFCVLEEKRIVEKCPYEEHEIVEVSRELIPGTKNMNYVLQEYCE